MLFFVLTMNPLTRKSRCSCSCPDNLCICCTQRKLDDSWYDLLQRYSSWLYMATFCMVNIDIASWTDDGRSCVGTFSGFIYFEWWVIQTWWNVTIDRLTDWEDTYTSISVLLIHMCYVNGTIIWLWCRSYGNGHNVSVENDLRRKTQSIQYLLRNCCWGIVNVRQLPV